jgi:drug/metabolite transporter (DMT)-like permease
MTPLVFVAVLAAAVMHASWNALIKIRMDRFASITATSFGMVVSSAPILPFVPTPGAAAWPFIAISIVIHIGYRLFLVRAYEVGDLAQTYPLARGTAPLITTLGGIVLLSQVPTPLTAIGILLLSAGTFLMSLRGGAPLARLNHRAVLYALLTSLFIAGYTLSDGIGANLATSAVSYAAWQFVCDGICAVAIGFAVRGRQLVTAFAAEWHIGLTAGFLSAAAYGIVIWAMTRAPIAVVASLRESSILFAMAISVFALGEKMTGWRGAAALSIVAGVIALKLS